MTTAKYAGTASLMLLTNSFAFCRANDTANMPQQHVEHRVRQASPSQFAEADFLEIRVIELRHTGALQTAALFQLLHGSSISEAACVWPLVEPNLMIVMAPRRIQKDVWQKTQCLEEAALQGIVQLGLKTIEYSNEIPRHTLP